MDCFIKKIFEGKSDELVHHQFQRFSKGEFKARALINVKKVKDNFNISTTFEYASEFVRNLAEKLQGKTMVTGVLVSTRDLTNELDFKSKKQFMGVKQYIIEKEMDKNEILDICDKFPNSFIGFSFKAENSELKIKQKAPNSGKPGTKSDEKPNPDFCKLKTNDASLFRAIVFDKEVSDFKKIEISHDFIINEMIIPSGEKDFAKMRELAKRKGKIIRYLDIDGKKIMKEREFEA